MENELKKSYKGFILWLILFIAASVFSAFALNEIIPEDYVLYSSLSITVISINILFYIIYRTEYVYWINGTSYEDAKKATSGERKEFAEKHLEKFTKATILWGIYGVAKFFSGISLVWDTLVFMLILIPSAISTIGIKLNH